MTETDEPEDNHRSLTQRVSGFIRKVAIAAAVLLFIWVYATKSINNLLHPNTSQNTTANGEHNPFDAFEAAAKKHKKQFEPRKMPEKDASETTPVPAAPPESSAPEPVHANDKINESSPPDEKNALPDHAVNTDTPVTPAKTAEPEPQKEIVIKEVESPASKERVAHLEDKLKEHEDTLASLQKQIREMQAQNARRLSALTTFAIMKEAALRGDPFLTQLSLLATFVGDDAKSKSVLDQLTPYASKGAVTVASLQTQFSDNVPKALAGDDHSSPLARNLKSLIRIRKVGEQQKGADDESVIARAEAKLGRGEIEGSLNEMAALSAPAAEAFDPWITNAKSFITIRNLMNELQLSLSQDRPDDKVTSDAEKQPSAPDVASEPAATKPPKDIAPLKTEKKMDDVIPVASDVATTALTKATEPATEPKSSPVPEKSTPEESGKDTGNHRPAPDVDVPATDETLPKTDSE